MILHDVEVEGRRVDVRISGGRIAEIADRLADDGVDDVDGYGGALLPGLHDHHVHLLATAAARASVDCSATLEPLRDLVGEGWIRGTGAAESVDRHVLDGLVPERPARVQHRSGALWMLNSAALRAVAHVLDDSADVERGPDGEPTGRLWRYDERLRPALPDAVPDLTELGEELLGYGITSVTEATPGLTALPGPLPVGVTFLGRRKLLLRDHDLPSFDDFATTISETHAEGLPVAVHCVTRESLLLTLAVLDEVGRLPGDRIEHASVVPDPGLLQDLHVVTQPAFVTTRGDSYRRDVDPDDLPHLYRYASLLEAGVATYPSSDAPYGPLDPWEVIVAAASRDLGPTERVTPRVALAGYLTDARFRPRRIAVGAPADVVLLECSLEEALAAPDSGFVRHTWTS
ncbi:amidohydrolase family protein [Nocardioides ferulae]|uniref:amidohydrolase family protein n=1 Tax=Nocardioides ferulae TaxID=2340821 RepID=UPI000EAF8FE6|nr:amidohydrolase family protein [Nocardioides ferulae]